MSRPIRLPLALVMVLAAGTSTAFGRDGVPNARDGRPPDVVEKGFDETLHDLEALVARYRDEAKKVGAPGGIESLQRQLMSLVSSGELQKKVQALVGNLETDLAKGAEQPASRLSKSPAPPPRKGGDGKSTRPGGAPDTEALDRATAKLDPATRDRVKRILDFVNGLSESVFGQVNDSVRKINEMDESEP